MSVELEDYHLSSVSIDRLYLGSNSVDFAKKIRSMFNFRSGFRSLYKDKYSARGFSIFTNPVFSNITPVKLIISTKVFKKELSKKLIDLLMLTNDWFVLAIDIAFDFEIPFSKAFVLTRANAKKKTFRQTENRYYFSQRSSSSALFYDKKSERALSGKQIDNLHLLRYEIRLKPRDKMPQVNLNFTHLEPLIEKHIFVTDYTKLNLSTEMKGIIRKAKRRNDQDLTGLGSEYTLIKIRQEIKRCRVPFFELFENEKERILGYILKHMN